MAYQIAIDDEIIVDNFAGGGGASTGIELAIGRPVDIAINHDKAAIAMHRMNHRFTEHYCESVWDADPVALCRGRKVALMWLSPDCKHFSKAKGGKPVEKHIRGLAWIALRWAALVKPRVIILENVEEFQTWGRIDKTTGRPDPKYKGETFQSFVWQLRMHGYEVQWKELTACDYGAPTKRKRFVLIARCDGKPIVFPKPTHGNGKGLKPYRTAADIIDWSLSCPSIFERKKPLVTATRRRIARGLDKFVIKNSKPFIIQTQFNNQPQSADKPLSTVESVNKHSIVMPHLTKFNDQSKGQGVDTPLDTVMAGATRFGEVETRLAPFIQHENFDNIPQSVEKPLSTITSATHQYLTDAKLAPYMMNISQTGGYGTDRQRSVEEPVRTICAKAEECIAEAKIMPFVEQAFGGVYDGSGSDIENPLPTITATDHNRLVGATLIQYHSETSDNEVRACEMEEPLPTVDTSNRYGVASAYIHKYYAGNYEGAGSDIAKPLDTITVEERHAVTMPYMTEFYGNEKDGTPCTQPLRTIMAKNKAAVVEVKVAKIVRGQNLGHWAEVRELLNEHAGYELADDEILLFKIDCAWWFIYDIGMRMLTPRELYRAQGFPEDYIIEFNVNGKPYSKKEQIARCGNAVCPPMAEAVVRANFPEYAVKKPIKTMAELEKAIVA